jgi:adenylate cyclase
VIVYVPSPVHRGHTLAATATSAAARRCGKMGAMSLRVTTWFYRKLGSLYPAAFLTVELQSALVVTAATVGLFTFYYDADGDQFLHALLAALALTALAIGSTLPRTYRRLRPIQRWIDGARGPDESARAWSAAVALPLELLRRDLPLPLTLTVIPSCAVGVALLELPWTAFFPFLAGAAVAVGYAAILHYLAIESGMRPVLIDISREVTPRLHTGTSAIPLRVRLTAALPLINIITGLVVAALTTEGGGGADLTLDVLVAVAVATTVSLELTLLLSKSILRPIADLQRATESVRAGRYDLSVPVTTADELGDLAASFNQMVAGLRERERIRKAFGTYLDEEIAEYILSEGFAEEGVEREVSILFCDVENFTGFASRASATEVVARLNELFEIVVPVVARHSGHVDKFEGDGLLAVFGAPESYPDHADRAVRAAVEMACRVNARDGLGFRIRAGVNTGRVVAGNIGGGGRLDFSVIGDPVNVAARTETATRTTGDDVLITAETARRLGSDFGLAKRPGVTLKGIDEPMTLYAPAVPDRVPEAGDGHAESLGRVPPARAFGNRPGPTHTL